MCSHAPIAKKQLSRHVLVDGVDRGLCVVTYYTDGKIGVRPFVAEEAAVSLVDHAITIDKQLLTDDINKQPFG